MNFLNCGVNELTNTTEDESFYGQWPCCEEIDIMEVVGSATQAKHLEQFTTEVRTQKAREVFFLVTMHFPMSFICFPANGNREN